MKSVGLRELKNRLAEYVRDVRAGESVLITDRGTVVAEMHPPGATTPESSPEFGLAALARAGRLRLGAPNDPALYPAQPRLLKHRRSADLLDQERGPR